MSVVVYTAIFSENGDELQSIGELPAGLACHAYVDYVQTPRLHETGWLLKPPFFQEPELGPRMLARKHKALSHQLYPDTKYTIWIDGCMTPKRDCRGFVNTMEKSGVQLLALDHGDRQCIYSEAEECRQQQKDTRDRIDAHIAKLKAEGYPYSQGLAETTLLVRRHSAQIAEFNELWWENILNGSVRDQLSFNYVAWKLGIDWLPLIRRPWQIREFAWRSHW